MIDGENLGLRMVLGLLVMALILLCGFLLVLVILAPLEMLAMAGLAFAIGGFAYVVGYIAEKVLDSI